MIVTRDSFDDAANLFGKAGIYGLDTETTGLTFDDRLFSIILANEEEEFYFNFQEYEGVGEEFVLLPWHLRRLEKVFSTLRRHFVLTTWFLTSIC